MRPLRTGPSCEYAYILQDSSTPISSTARRLPSAMSQQPSKTELQLYPHDPSTLLPLLAAYLPYSLAVYGTIVSNPQSSVPIAWATFPTDAIPTAPKTVSSDQASASITGAGAGTVPDLHATSTADDDVPMPTEVWSIIMPTPEAEADISRSQIRLFNNVEHPSLRCRTAYSLTDGQTQQDDRSIVDRAKQQVLDTLTTYISTIDPGVRVAGCVHRLWAEGVEDLWGLEEGERRGWCGAWVTRVSQVDDSGRVSQGVSGVRGVRYSEEELMDGYRGRIGT